MSAMWFSLAFSNHNENDGHLLAQVAQCETKLKAFLSVDASNMLFYNR